MSALDSNPLVPAVHPADRIRVNGEGQILVHSAFLPEDSLRIRIVAFEWFDALDLSKPPSIFT
jgi:hypothetical protein